jgi:hypothetical protein
MPVVLDQSRLRRRWKCLRELRRLAGMFGGLHH